jgi:hypothetical protein
MDAHPIIRMFTLCESMKWAHLPVAGGIYDQHPDLLDGFMIILHERSKHEAEEAKKEKAKSERGMRTGGPRSRR